MRSSRFRALSALAPAIALAALTASTSSPLARASESSDAFPGVWRVTVTPDDAAQQSGVQQFGDEVLFEEGKMTAAACSSYGFGAAQYSVSSDGNTFSTMMSTDSESIVWSASVNGGSLRGTVVWTKADGHVYHYSLAGSRFTDSDSFSDGSGSSSSN